MRGSSGDKARRLGWVDVLVFGFGAGAQIDQAAPYLSRWRSSIPPAICVPAEIPYLALGCMKPSHASALSSLHFKINQAHSQNKNKPQKP